MKILSYSSLPSAAADIRREVFMEEQGFRDEFDSIDPAARHLVLYADDGRAAATCRYFWDKGSACYVIGRVAVRKSCRSKGLGAAVVLAAEREIAAAGGGSIALDAQTHAAGFYKRLGYCAIGEMFYEEHCPHIRMQKELGV